MAIIVAPPAAAKKKARPAPDAAMTKPATDGATMRVPDQAMEVSGAARGMCDLSGSKRGNSDARLGSSNDWAAPSARAASARFHIAAPPVAVSSASVKSAATDTACAPVMSARGSNRSASTPPARFTAMRGAAPTRLTKPSASGEPVRWNASHPSVTMVICWPVTCATSPIQKRRKSRKRSAEKNSARPDSGLIPLRLWRSFARTIRPL